MAELRSLGRMARTWVFVGSALAVALTAYGYYSYIHDRAGFSPSAGYFSPRYTSAYFTIYLLWFFMVAVVFLGFDVRARDERAGIAEVLDSRTVSNVTVSAGWLCAVVLAVVVPLFAALILIQVAGVVAQATGFEMLAPVESVSVLTFLAVDAIPALVLWCAWVLLLAAALQNRLAVAVVALALLASHMWALALVPTYLLPALSPTAIHDIWASDLAPRFPEPETYVQRLAELLLAVGFLLSAAVLFQRRDGIAPRRGGAGRFVVVVAPVRARLAAADRADGAKPSSSITLAPSPWATDEFEERHTMPMNVKPVPTLDDEVNEVRLATAEIVNNDILPFENNLWAHRTDGGRPSKEQFEEANERRMGVQNKVKKAKLWAPHLPPEFGGMGLSFLQHAYMNEVLAYSPGAASLFGVVAPNSGNQKILVKYGSPEQHEQWLKPLTEGRMQSAFSMTEPHNAGSDPRSIQTRAVLDGDEWVINGHKWFTSNGHAADFYIVMCRTSDPDDPGGSNDKMTQIIVPKKTPGVNIVRGVPVWGKASSHCEIIYDDVRVPKTNQLGGTGTGHQAAQDRLGAGRIYHCMNSVGAMWRCFDLMVDRIMNRTVHGGEKLEEKQFMQGFIADSYMDIQASRLMVVDCAWKMEEGADSRTDISSIKVFVPNAYHRVVDRAIQVYGAAGVSGDYPFAGMYEGARTLRIADGPDEVHKILIAKNVLRRYHAGESWDFGN